MENIQAGKLFNIIIAIFIIVFAGLTAKGIYLRHKQIEKLKAESVILDSRISMLKKNIEHIKRQINLAKQDPNYIKHKATERYLITNDKNETILIFSPKDR